MPEILYEDNHILVAVKPPNMLSQADRTGDKDILTLLKEDIKLRYNKPGNVYLGLVHRLDRPVGGLGLVVVKRLADRVSYSYEDGRNVLTLIRKAVGARHMVWCADRRKGKKKNMSDLRRYSGDHSK